MKTTTFHKALLAAASSLFCLVSVDAIEIVVPDQYKDQVEAIKAAEREQRERELQGVTEGAEAGGDIAATDEAPADQAVAVEADEFVLQSVVEAVETAAEFEGTLDADEGIISGQILDKETGEPLAGVAIIIDGTDIATVTAEDGRYSLGPAPAGVYTVSFIKSGYIEANVTDYAVAGGQVSVFPFALPPRPADMSDEVYELQDFTVTAEEANDLMLKLDLVTNSAATLNIMTAEDFSKFAASDIGDAVKRVSGVSIEGGKYAVVRGLGDRYVKTTMNGLPIASPDPDRLAVQLDMFPTSLFSSVEVTKTFTPDQPGTSTGAINLIVNPIPEEFFLKVSISAGFNSATHGSNKYSSNNRGNSLDRWAMGAGDRAFPGGAAEGPFPDIFGKTITPNQALADLLPSIFISQADFDAGLETLTEISESVGAAKHIFGDDPEINHGFKASFGDVYELGNSGVRLGFIAGVNYSLKSEFVEDAEYFRSFVDPAAASSFSPENFVNPGVAIGYHRGLLTESITTATLSGSASFGVEFSEDHQVNLTFLDLNISENINARLDARGPEGSNFGRYYQFPFRDNWDPTFGTPDYDSTGNGSPDTVASLDYQLQESLRYVERGLRRVQLGGNHSIEVPELIYGEIDLNWGLSDDTAFQDEPGYLQTRGIVSSLDGDFTLSTNATSSASPEPSYLIWRKILDERESRRLDFKLLEDGYEGFESTLKFGILTSESERNVFDQYLELTFPEEVVPGSDDEDAPLQNFDGLFPTAYAVAADVDLETSSRGNYFMIDQKLFDNFRLIAGYRYESNSADVSVNGQTILRGAGFNNPFEDQPTEGGYDEDSVLPSFTLIWKGFDERLTIRGAYSQTIALPSAREVSPYASSELAGSDVEVGNISLGPSSVENYDIGATFATESGDSITVNLFRKYVEDRIERVAGIGSDSSDSDDFGDYEIFAFSQNVGAGIFSWYNNPNEAELNGIEIEIRKDLGFIGLEGFSVGGNYTYIEGEVDRFPVEVAAKVEAGILDDEAAIDGYRSRQLTGQPEEIFSGDITYENEDWGLRVSLIGYYISDVLRGTSLVNSYDVFEESYTAFDLTISKRVNDNFKVGFTAKNLTDSKRGTFFQSVENTDSGLDFGEISRDSYRKGRTFSLSLSYEY